MFRAAAVLACSGVGAVLALLTACSDDPTPLTSEPPDASLEASATPGPDDAGSDASGGAKERCTTLVPPTELVEPTAVGGEMPEYTGGAVAPGTYLLTKIEVYGGAALGLKKSGVYEVGADSTIETAEDVDGTITETRGTLASEGNEWGWTLACPGEYVIGFLYSAAGTEVRIGQPDGKRVQVWTRQ